MLNWLLSLINKRQQQLFRENERLREQNRRYKMAYEELALWVDSLENYTSTIRILTESSTEQHVVETNAFGVQLSYKIRQRLKALQEKINGY